MRSNTMRKSFASSAKLDGASALKDGKDYALVYEVREAVGSDDSVFLATCKDNDVEYVSRTLEKADMPLSSTADLPEYLQTLAQLDHSHICRFIEAYDHGKQVHLIYEKAKPVSIFDEVPELRSGKPLNQDKAQEFCRHIAAALRVAHKQGFAHGRLCTTSLLVDPNGDAEDGSCGVKICDFGQTWIMRLPRADSSARADFEAPESLWGDLTKPNSTMHFRSNLRQFQCIDMWSFGIIIYRMLTGKMPFVAGKASLHEVIRDVAVDFGAEWKRMPDARDLVTSLLKKDGRIRISAEKVLRHPWMCVTKEKVSKSKMARVLQNVIFNTTESTFKKFCLRVIAEDMPLEKVEVVVKAFRLIDKNCDGNLEVNEIATALRKFGEEEELAGEIFAAVDRDASGTLNFPEFMAVSIGTAEYSDKETLWYCFNRFDKDGNGMFDREEIAQVVHEVENTVEKELISQQVEEIASDVQMPMDFDTFVAHMTTPAGAPINNMSLGLHRFCSNVCKVDMHGVRHITPKTYDHAGPNVLKMVAMRPTTAGTPTQAQSKKRPSK